MTTLLTLLEHSIWAEQIGWTLLHSLWQLAMISALYAVYRFLMRNASPHVHYLAGCAALSMMLLAPVATFFWLAKTPAQRAVAMAVPANGSQTIAQQLGRSDIVQEPASRHAADQEPISIAETPELSIEPILREATSRLAVVRPLLPWLTTGWLVGVALLSVRPLLGVVAVRRLRRRGLSMLHDDLLVVAERVARKLQLKRVVQFAQSSLVDVPAVIGWFKPLVLVPAGAAAGLSAAQFEIIVAHELGHVRRHDYLVNLVQLGIETLLFYHPGVWWVSSKVRRDRELCCDELAVAACGNRIDYAKALYSLENARQGVPLVALGATGGSLAQRVRRLISAEHRAHTPKGGSFWFAIVIVSALAVVISLALTSIPQAAARQQPNADKADSSDPNAPQEQTYSAVRLIFSLGDKLEFEGETTTWVELPGLLEKVSDRSRKVLEVAISSDDVSVRQMNNAVATASAQARQLGFKYTSYVGVHRKDEGSKATAGPKAAPAAKSLAADLAGGGTVELVGIAAHPSAGERWWAPDGTPLKSPPYFRAPGSSSASPDRMQREFVFQFRDLPKNVEIGYWSSKLDGLPAGSVCVGVWDPETANDPNVRKLPGQLLALVNRFEPDQKTASISLGVAARPRRLVLTVDNSGKVTGGEKEWQSAVKDIHVAKHDGHRERGWEGEVVTYFSFDRPEMSNFDVDVVAIDRQGEKNFRSQWPVWKPEVKGYGCGFFIPLEEIREFRILSRSQLTDYDWFTFENVSLQLNHHAKPSAQIDHFVAQNQPAKATQVEPQVSQPGSPLAPREVVIHWLDLVKRGKAAWEFVTKGSSLGGDLEIENLWAKDKLKIYRVLRNERAAMVITNQFRDNAGQDRMLRFYLVNDQGKWLINARAFIDPQLIDREIAGFRAHPGVAYHYQREDLAGAWVGGQLAPQLLVLRPDGTFEQTAVGGRRVGGTWKVDANILHRQISMPTEENLALAEPVLEIKELGEGEMTLTATNPKDPSTNWLMRFKRLPDNQPLPGFTINETQLAMLPEQARKLAGMWTRSRVFGVWVETFLPDGTYIYTINLSGPTVGTWKLEDGKLTVEAPPDGSKASDDEKVKSTRLISSIDDEKLVLLDPETESSRPEPRTYKRVSTEQSIGK